MTTKKKGAVPGHAPAAGKPEIRARCGFLCSSCPAYKENARTPEDRERASRGWKILYDLDIPAEIMHCDGCLEPDENNPFRIGKDCPIRTCVLEKKIAHCGECGTFPCELMGKHLASVETVVPKAKETMTPEEFHMFVDPYLCRRFLSGTRT